MTRQRPEAWGSPARYRGSDATGNGGMTAEAARHGGSTPQSVGMRTHTVKRPPAALRASGCTAGGYVAPGAAGCGLSRVENLSGFQRAPKNSHPQRQSDCRCPLLQHRFRPVPRAKLHFRSPGGKMVRLVGLHHLLATRKIPRINHLATHPLTIRGAALQVRGPKKPKLVLENEESSESKTLFRKQPLHLSSSRTS